MAVLQFMPDATPQERLQALQNTADRVTEDTYYRPLTEEDLNERREIISDNEIKISDIIEEKKQAIADFKDMLDPIKKQKTKILYEIRTKQVEEVGRLFQLANYADNMMETYDSNGYLISTRRLKANEMQASIFNQGGGKLSIAQ